MENVPEATANLAAENAAKLLKLFPECAGERGEVDFEKLKQTLADHVIEGDVERYQFTWPGKRAAMAEANVPTTKTLAPCEEESVDFAKTQNLYIEGDNLEVLKILRASYLGKVKMIYIDPPYNTGHDFVYHDHFAITQEEADQRGGNVDELGRRFTENSESNPRYHSDWCSMMYPRLKLARDLMRDDGVIFISIDDNEIDCLKQLCGQVFHPENFRNTLFVRRRVKSLNSQFADQGLSTLNVGLEYVLAYAKSDKFIMNALRVKKQNPPTVGRWDVFWSNADRPTMRYDVLGFTPATGQWRTSKEKADIAVANYKEYQERFAATMTLEEYWKLTGKDEFIRRIPEGTGKNGGVQHWIAPSDTMLRTSNWSDIEVSEIGKEFDLPFDNPKNKNLILELLKLSCDKESDSLVLDFFSGSATTAHAVMQLNAEDGGHRKFILVQLPEVCAEGSEAAKAGYKNICEIGKERIRRAGKKIVEKYSPTESAEGAERREDDLFSVCAQPQTDSADSASSAGDKTTPVHLDIGFRVLKLVDSPMVDASKPAGATTQQELSFSSVKDGVKDDALLFHTMLRLGIAPTDTIEYKTIEGNKVACVGGVQLVAALDARTQMTNALIEAIAKMNPGVAVFRDDTFRNNNALRISLEQTFKQLSPETKIEVI